MMNKGEEKKGGMERRRAKRYEVNHQFQSVDEFLREYAMNVSASGVFIRTDEPLLATTPTPSMVSKLSTTTVKWQNSF